MSETRDIESPGDFLRVLADVLHLTRFKAGRLNVQASGDAIRDYLLNSGFPRELIPGVPAKGDWLPATSSLDHTLAGRRGHKRRDAVALRLAAMIAITIAPSAAIVPRAWAKLISGHLKPVITDVAELERWLWDGINQIEARLPRGITSARQLTARIIRWRGVGALDEWPQNLARLFTLAQEHP